MVPGWGRDAVSTTDLLKARADVHRLVSKIENYQDSLDYEKKGRKQRIQSRHHALGCELVLLYESVVLEDNCRRLDLESTKCAVTEINAEVRILKCLNGLFDAQNSPRCLQTRKNIEQNRLNVANDVKLCLKFENIRVANKKAHLQQSPRKQPPLLLTVSALVLVLSVVAGGAAFLDFAASAAFWFSTRMFSNLRHNLTSFATLRRFCSIFFSVCKHRRLFCASNRPFKPLRMRTSALISVTAHSVDSKLRRRQISSRTSES